MTDPDALALQLSEAVVAGEVDRVAGLLGQGAPADVFSRVHPPGFQVLLDGDRQPLLWVAIHVGQAEIARLLLLHGAPPDQQARYARAELLGDGTVDEDMGSALDLAARLGRSDLAKLLLAHGAHVDTACESGRTPLMTAARFRHADLVQLLLDAGADPCRVDDAGRTALDLAKEMEANEVVGVLTAPR